MIKLNSVTEATILIDEVSPNGTMIYGRTSPISLDPSRSIAWDKANERFGKWVIMSIYSKWPLAE